MMSTQMLLGLICQMATLLHRGQSWGRAGNGSSSGSSSSAAADYGKIGADTGNNGSASSINATAGFWRLVSACSNTGEWKLSSLMWHRSLYMCVLATTSVHALLIALRAYLRGGIEDFTSLHYSLWILITIFSLGGFFVGYAVNAHDSKRHNMALQFARLDFDTKLGMHSPR